MTQIRMNERYPHLKRETLGSFMMSRFEAPLVLQFPIRSKLFVSRGSYLTLEGQIDQK